MNHRGRNIPVADELLQSSDAGSSFWSRRASPQSKQISDIEDVEIVFKDGLGYDSQKLLDSVKGRYGAH